jgi:hypothetical protein
VSRSEPNVPSKPLSQARAIYCFVINQLATPGLGSLLGRRIFAGTCQLILAVAGFALLVGWMGQYFYRLWLQQSGEPSPGKSYDWLGEWGLAVFGAAWLWSLFTSISLLRQAKAEEQTETGRVPPRIG